MEAKPLRVYMKQRGLKGNPFLQKVLIHIEAHPLFRHPFFEAFERGKLREDQVKAWAKQRLFPSQNFPRSLGAFISNIEDIDARTVYVKQIYEEHGNLDSEKVHCRQLANLVFALGVSKRELENERMLPNTRRFVGTYRRISQEGDVL